MAIGSTPASTPSAHEGTPRATTAAARGGQAAIAIRDVRSVVIDPKTPTRIYAATGQGVFRSEDAADTWSAIDTGLPKTAIVTLALHPVELTRLYAATADGRLFRTDNAGAAWRELP